MSARDHAAVTGGAKEVTLLRVEAEGVSSKADLVAIEEPLEIQLSFERRGTRVVKSVAVTMRTPGHDRELAAGFLFTEGIITQAEEIETWETPVAASPRAALGNSVRVVLRPGVEFDLRGRSSGTFTPPPAAGSAARPPWKRSA